MKHFLNTLSLLHSLAWDMILGTDEQTEHDDPL